MLLDGVFTSTMFSYLQKSVFTKYILLYNMKWYKHRLMEEEMKEFQVNRTGEFHLNNSSNKVSMPGLIWPEGTKDKVKMSVPCHHVIVGGSKWLCFERPIDFNRFCIARFTVAACFSSVYFINVISAFQDFKISNWTCGLFFRQ